MAGKLLVIQGLGREVVRSFGLVNKLGVLRCQDGTMAKIMVLPTCTKQEQQLGCSGVALRLIASLGSEPRARGPWCVRDPDSRNMGMPLESCCTVTLW